MIWNEIKGFFQRVKDSLVRLLPTGHGNHFADTLDPGKAGRHIRQSNPGSHNTYAGGRGNDGRFMGRSRQGSDEPDSPGALFMYVAKLRLAGVMTDDEALQKNDLIMEMD